MKTPKAPAHLSERSRAWWRSVTTVYALEDHHLKLLEACCVAFDRLEQARVILAVEGLVVNGKQGPKAHPMLAVERDSRIAVARLIRELDLDTELAPGSARPPALRSNRR